MVYVAGLELSSSILTPLSDYAVVNPKKQKTNADGYYPKDVANNLKTYLYISTGIYVFLGVVAFIFCFWISRKRAQETEEKEVKEKKNISLSESFGLIRTKKYLMLLSFCICGLCKYNNIKVYILYILIYSYNF